MLRNNMWHLVTFFSTTAGVKINDCRDPLPVCSRAETVSGWREKLTQTYFVREKIIDGLKGHHCCYSFV